MTLDELMTKGGKPTPYKTDVFYNSQVTAQELPQLNLNSRDGLTRFSELTGYDLASQPLDRVEYDASGIIGGYTRDTRNYALSHFSGLFGELDERAQANFALQFVPEKSYDPTEGSELDEDPFEETRKKVLTETSILEKIRGEPDAYLKQEITRLEGSIAGRYIAQKVVLNPSEYLGLVEGIAYNAAIGHVNNFGALKFVTETRSRIEAPTKEYNDKVTELRKQSIPQLEAIEENRNNGVYNSQAEYAEAQAKAQEGVKKVQEAMIKANPDLVLIDRMNEGIIEPALKTIATKKAQAAAKKKADEEAEKK